jgi:hypothetical protein
MKAARCAPALCGGKPNDLAVGTASHRLNFLAARPNGTENLLNQPAIRRMSVGPPSTVQGYGNRGRPLDPRTRANVDALLVIGRSGEGKNGVAGTRRREE